MRNDGKMLGLRAKVTMDAGAYPNIPFVSAMFFGTMQQLMPGPYHLDAYQFESLSVSTNKAVYVAYRGPWAVETWVRERLLDIAANELGMDRLEFRYLGIGFATFIEAAPGPAAPCSTSGPHMTPQETS